ncbi:MAG TPA: nicotinate-nucleotide adenylyltransferase [Thermoleophilaceae bacterium]|nr:nicotinate-nucleotide adenylyltransferase [Thermoleophilaceae bacterium]
MRVGIFGGAFNPPHLGHLVCAQESLLQLGLDRLVLVPVGQAPHRQLEDDPGAEVRLEMVELAVAEDHRFSVSRTELDRKGPSYTADTLEALRAEAPGDEMFLILGGDQAAALPSWHEPERVLEHATVAVVERTGWTRNGIGIRIGRLRGADRVRYLDMPLIQISSTALRRRVREGVPIRYLVPPAVERFIEERGLYAPAAGTVTATGATKA